ncbi:hypothetical protein SCUCBS95973_000750 [Sporothrix curviconia]|uniref:tRNA(Ile)-lysidine synthetase n=1 Tax=Sporothrix curviconia TaxID=1260050 RepID=A0ABP0ASV8_9PEZI
MHPVLHRIAQPIAIHEFIDALHAAAPPRFPHGRAPSTRRVGLAISGGVDSMALAYLCAEALKVEPHLRISDTPTSGFTALVVDHGLREGSADEAAAVGKALTRMGHRAHIFPLRWPGRSGAKNAPPSTSALETNARRLRYRCLGMQLAYMRIVSLLLAHHEDDQYETILMRLLSGYGLNGGIRGLRGMRVAGDLPECHGIYGANQSGFLDEQRLQLPYVMLRPDRGERMHMLKAFRKEMQAAAAAELQTALEGGGISTGDTLSLSPTDMGLDVDDDSYDYSYGRAYGYGYGYNYNNYNHTSGTMRRPWQQPFADLPWPASQNAPPPLAAMETEDMGVMAYRPLLQFPKDRLVATCLANNVPWFEDHTNADPTLTMRNALRHVARNHTLPVALQKPAILQLAARCDQQARQHEAEARRLLMRHGAVERFTPNVGTIMVRLPRMQGWARQRPGRKRARTSPARTTRPTDWYAVASLEKRRRYLRTIAGLVVQKLLSFVTPEANVAPISQLQSVINTLFPELVDPTEPPRDSAAIPSNPKSFIMCGVHFMPVREKASEAPGGSSSPRHEREPVRSWYLARAPHSAAERGRHDASGALVSPLAVWFPGKSIAQRWNKHPKQWAWSKWTRWRLYDGRFWVRTRTRLPVHVVLQPFDEAHSKPFREALASTSTSSSSNSSQPQLMDLLATLKAHAPGKVRYTLPALYVSSDIAWALEGGPYWPDVDAAEKAWAVRAHERQQIVSGDYVGEGDADEAILIDTRHYRDYYSTHPPVYRPTGLGRRDDLFMWERHLRVYERAQHQRQLAESEGADGAAASQPSQAQRTVNRLLALPTLGVHIPGIEDWLQSEVRYRKVDTEVVESGQAAAFERMYEKGHLASW